MVEVDKAYLKQKIQEQQQQGPILAPGSAVILNWYLGNGTGLLLD